MTKRLLLTLSFLLAATPALAQNSPVTYPAVRITSTADDALCVGGSGVSPASCTGGVKLGTINLGHLTDTTITRVSAGVIAVEGVTVVLNGTAPTLTGTNFTEIPAAGVSGTAVTLSGTQTITGTKRFDAPIGVTLAPSAWGTDYFNAVEFGQMAATYGQTNALGEGGLTLNAYLNSSAQWKAIAGAGSGVAAKLSHTVSGTPTLTWNLASSLTAGDTITWTPALTVTSATASLTGCLGWGGGACLTSSSGVALLAGAAFTGGISVTHATASLASFDSTAANGGYITYKDSGVDKAYFGSALATMGVGDVDDFAVRSYAGGIYYDSAASHGHTWSAAGSTLMTLSSAGALTPTDNIILGSNYLSGDGGDEGITIDSSGNAGVTGSLYPVNDDSQTLGDSSHRFLSLNMGDCDSFGCGINFWDNAASDRVALQFTPHSTAPVFKITVTDGSDSNILAIYDGYIDTEAYRVGGTEGCSGTPSSATNGIVTTCPTPDEFGAMILGLSPVTDALTSIWDRLTFLEAELARLRRSYRR